MHSKEEIINLLTEIIDPELPAVNIVELKIVRDVVTEGNKIRVDISPTYSGCPALTQIKDEIISTLKLKGYSDIEINTVYTPDWTTEWLSNETKQKIRESGIAPPIKFEITDLLENGVNDSIACPFCSSDNTEIRSFFGSTPCKSLYFCNSCSQPFEYFKRF